MVSWTPTRRPGPLWYRGGHRRPRSFATSVGLLVASCVAVGVMIGFGLGRMVT